MYSHNVWHHVRSAFLSQFNDQPRIPNHKLKNFSEDIFPATTKWILMQTTNYRFFRQRDNQFLSAQGGPFDISYLNYPGLLSRKEIIFLWIITKIEVNFWYKIDDNIKECRSIVRDESSVYFNVTAKHVWHLVATVYKPTVPCMITIELSDIWLISEAIYHLIFTQDILNWSLESPPQHRDDFVMPTFLYRVKNSQKC